MGAACRSLRYELLMFLFAFEVNDAPVSYTHLYRAEAGGKDTEREKGAATAGACQMCIRDRYIASHGANLRSEVQ